MVCDGLRRAPALAGRVDDSSSRSRTFATTPHLTSSSLLGKPVRVLAGTLASLSYDSEQH
jgi:hypothetical protein